jgi:hypothetical protein
LQASSPALYKCKCTNKSSDKSNIPVPILRLLGRWKVRQDFTLRARRCPSGDLQTGGRVEAALAASWHPRQKAVLEVLPAETRGRGIFHKQPLARPVAAVAAIGIRPANSTNLCGTNACSCVSVPDLRDADGEGAD